jgi:hypothetical protein
MTWELKLNYLKVSGCRYEVHAMSATKSEADDGSVTRLNIVLATAVTGQLS